MRRFDEKDSQRPPDLKFIQQKLPVSHPVLTVRSIIPTLLIIAAICISLGIGFLLSSNAIQEESVEYSKCKSLEYPELTCEEVLNGSAFKLRRDGHTTTILSNITTECHCMVDFELKKDMNGTIFIYYALTNFYQNNLKYYLSRDVNQLKGIIGNLEDLEKPATACGECNGHDITHACDNLGRYVIPCGLQASTMFNDVIQLKHIDPLRYRSNFEGRKTVPLIRTGIAYKSDRFEKFKNPPRFNNPKDPIWLKFTKPLGWKKNLWELDLQIRNNNGLHNEDFIIWMKTSAFPNFRKLYRIVDSTNPPFEKGLPAGNYSLVIEYNYPVEEFSGSKTIIFTTSRMTAGRNYFLSSALVVTGLILLVICFAFFIIHIVTKNRDLQCKKE